MTIEEWIPCSKRLPKKDGRYLTTLVDSDGAFVDITEWQNIIGGRWPERYHIEIPWEPKPENH